VRRVTVIALVLLTLAPPGVRAATWFRSDGDGALRAQCCCPVHPGKRGPAAPSSELRSACCCTIISLAARDATERAATPPIDAGATPAAAPVVTDFVPPRAPIVAAIGQPRTTRGPPSDPDLFARNCAWLL
jgi:hypothetical protein